MLFDFHRFFCAALKSIIVWQVSCLFQNLYFNDILRIIIHIKEYIERRHGEPFKFLFLPKMGLLGSQAVLEKKVQFWIMSNFLAPFFQLFMGKKLFFKLFFYIAASALKSCLIKKFKKLKKKFGRIFFGLKTGFFRASCFGFRVPHH